MLLLRTLSRARLENLSDGRRAVVATVWEAPGPVDVPFTSRELDVALQGKRDIALGTDGVL